MKKALITGVTGQDGAYLAELLVKKGYKVYGTYRRTSTPNFWRLQSLGIFSKINLIPADLLDMGSLVEAVHVSDPDELYNYIECNIMGVMKKMGILLDYRLYKADTIEYFEREVPLAARNSQEAKALKKVWVDIYLLDEDRGMCDMIQNLILPIFVEQRMAELHKLKHLYIDYRQKLYRYESFERIDDGEMNIQDFEFIEPKDGWILANKFPYQCQI